MIKPQTTKKYTFIGTIKDLFRALLTIENNRKSKITIKIRHFWNLDIFATSLRRICDSLKLIPPPKKIL